MKWFIASDIHGSAYYCEKLIEAFEKEKADKILLLGDILYHGPRNDLPKDYNPKKVIAMLNNLKSFILAVRGNCDTEVDQMVLEFPILADYAVITAGKRLIYATHGHNHNNSALPPLTNKDILLHGHTHVPVCEIYDTHTYINPGSVSIPKENSPHSYMVFDGKNFVWKNLEGEIYKTFEI
ncbi:MAG: phosphodiesterase [Ruminococcaceae bacterium]|nr:phosphodiesterase [Oscillospiraceae bacterium]